MVWGNAIKNDMRNLVVLVNGPAYMINVASWTFGTNSPSCLCSVTTLLFLVLKVTRSFEGKKNSSSFAVTFRLLATSIFTVMAKFCAIEPIYCHWQFDCARLESSALCTADGAKAFCSDFRSLWSAGTNGFVMFRSRLSLTPQMLAAWFCCQAFLFVLSFLV